MGTTITRGVRIVQALTERGRTVADLAKEFDVHRTTMFRDLKTLEGERFVRRRSDGTYVLGLRLIELGQVAIGNVTLHRPAEMHARALQRAVGHTIHVAALLDDQIAYVYKVADDTAIPTYSRLGAPVVPYCTAVGKAILAHCPTERRSAILVDHPWRQYTPKTLRDEEGLDAQLSDISRLGWARDDGEFEDFINCVAVPIMHGPEILGAISFSVPKAVAGLDELQLRVPLLVRAARLISRDIRSAAGQAVYRPAGPGHAMSG